MSYAEYCRLLGLDCSPELRRKLDSALKVYDSPEPERYAYMSTDDEGKCMLLDGDGLCSLQRECGAAVLSGVCRMYPRAVHIGAAAEPVCSGSCEAVLERLIEDPEPIEFRVVYQDVSAPVPEIADSELQIELRRRCIEAIQDRSEDLITGLLSVGRIVLGEEHPIPEHDLREYIVAAIALIEDFSPLAPSLAECGSAALRALGITGRADVTAETLARFDALQKRIISDIPEIEAYFGKIFANHMYYEQFPYTSECRSVREAYVAFCAVFVICTFVAVCCHDESRPVDAFVDSLASVFRTVEHSAFYKNANIILKADGGL